MSRFKRFSCLVALVCAVFVGFLPSSASASSCIGVVNRDHAYSNTAWAVCGSGFGYIRVKLECQSGSWPYVGYVYGPWVFSASGLGKSYATCPGGSWLTLVHHEVL